MNSSPNESQALTPTHSKFNPNIPIPLAVVILMAVVVFAVEIVLSIVEGNKVFRHSVSEIRTIRLKEHPPFGRFIVSPDVYYLETTDSLQRKMYLMEMDENGFIAPTTVHEYPDLKIFFLGGSTTECMFVTDKNRFPYKAGRLIEERTGKKVNAYNGGVSGNHSFHSLDILLHKILPMKPDAVCMLHNVNDLNILLYEGSYWNENPTRSLVDIIEIHQGEPAPTLIRRTKDIVRTFIPHLYRRMAIAKKQWRKRGKNQMGLPEFDEFAHLRGKKLVYNAEEIVRAFEHNLQMFVDIVREAEAVPVLITQANRFKDDPDPVVKLNLEELEDMGIGYREYKTLYDRFNQAIRDVGEKNDILTIDLARLIPQESQYMYDTMHFNEEGSLLAARHIADSLIPCLDRQ